MIFRLAFIPLCLVACAAMPAQAELPDKEKGASEIAILNQTQKSTLTETKKGTKNETNLEVKSNNNINEAIKPNEKTKRADEKLAQIEVTGVDSELKKNIELHMPVTIPNCTADRGEVRLFFANVKKQLRKASRALGYYDAEFRSGGKVENNCWKLRLRITPGQATKVVDQTIKVIGEGSKDEIFLKILENKPYQKGDVLDHDKYSSYKTQLSEAAQALGYFDAEFEQHSIKVNPTTYQASVSLVLNTNKRYRYGEISVSQDILSDKTFKEYLTLKTDQPYDAEGLIKQQQFLQGAGYYKLIKVEVLHEQIKDFRVPIKITLTSKKRNNYKFKVGYGSDTGARVSAEMKRRWTGSKGKQLNAKVQLAQNLSSINLELIDPQKNPDDNVIVYHIDLTKDKNDDVDSSSIGIGGKFTRKNTNDWIQTATLDLLLDETQVEGQNKNQSVYLLFGVGLEKTKADDLLYPEEGWRLRYNLKAAADAVLSDQNVIQFEALGKYINKAGKGRIVSRLQLGTTLVDNFDVLPKSLRFFAGGSNSVRGYEFESLGEINTDGKVIGGKQLLNLSLEYQHPITEEWGAAVFIDAGNAFDDWSDTKLKVGAGFGARWRSPIGPVRIDIGFPKDDLGKPQLHLSVGSEL